MIDVSGGPTAHSDRILTSAALAFLADLHRRFDRRRRQLL